MNSSISKSASAAKAVASIYSAAELATIALDKVPRHIAIIPDGSRRWAIQQQAAPQRGHQQGADTLIETMKAAKELGVETITFYTFSTENWKRPKGEVDGLMWLIESYLTAQRDAMIEEDISLETIGNLTQLPPSLQDTIAETQAETAHCSTIRMVLAINYGSRDEICRAMKSVYRDVASGAIKVDAIDEALVSSYLDSAAWGDPDFLIRTSGEKRISNFLNWQLAYTEIYTPQVLWPDFTASHLLEAIQHYQRRIRRYGN